MSRNIAYVLNGRDLHLLRKHEELSFGALNKKMMYRRAQTGCQKLSREGLEKKANFKYVRPLWRKYLRRSLEHDMDV